MPVGAGNVHFTYQQLMGLWIQAGGRSQAAPMAAAIAMAESGGNSAAYLQDSNGSTDRGLWQINSVHGAQSTFDVMGNARAAVAISNNGTNWSPWVTYQTGAYRQFLQQNAQPDTNVPINATNAAANIPNAQTEQVSVNCLLPQNWAQCAAGAITGQGGGTDIAGSILGPIVGNILNPIVSVVAGVIGMVGGGVLMIFGMLLIIESTKTGQQVTGAGLTGVGVATGQPELIGAGRGVSSGGIGGGVQRGSMERGRTLRSQQAEQRQIRQGQRVEARQSRLTAQRGYEQRRLAYGNAVAAQLREESRNYQEYQRSYRAYLRSRG